jgi:phosphatidylinositol 4-phosphatase
VQSVIAKHTLKLQLEALNIMPHTKTCPYLDSVFQNGVLFTNIAWADHADIISMQYSGTGALKTDFTRTGKRSVFGVLQDVANSAMRYVKNYSGVKNVVDSAVAPSLKI